MPMLLPPMRHLILLLALLSGLLFGVRSAAALDVGDKAPGFYPPEHHWGPHQPAAVSGQKTPPH